MIRSRFSYLWHLSPKSRERYAIALKKIVLHLSSIEFWRLFAFLSKRFISVFKIFFFLPFIFTPLMYVFHFIRASLRIIGYFYKTKNKNLGETRKLIFSICKVSMAVAAFVLCFFMPIPTVLLSGFLLYSVLKLVDSTGVFVFSVAAHFNIDDRSVENQWRRQQYWSNINRHIRILAPGVSMTLLSGLLLGIGLINPAALCALVITAIVTIIGLAYLAGLFYRSYASKTAESKAEYSKTIKNFAKIFLFWLCCCLAVSIAFVLPVAPAVGVITGFLFLFYLYDISVSLYFYFNKNSDKFKVNHDLIEENSLEDSGLKCYYGSRNPLFFSKQTTAEVVIKETLVYIYQLKNKLRQWEQQKNLWIKIKVWWEKPKIEAKINGLVGKLAEMLKHGKNDRCYLNSLTMILKEVEKKLDLEAEKLDGKPLNLKTLQNIKNMTWFKQDLADLISVITSGATKRTKQDNVLLDLYLQGMDTSSKTKELPKKFYQSFWRTEGWASLLEKFIDNYMKTPKGEAPLPNGIAVRSEVPIKSEVLLKRPMTNGKAINGDAKKPQLSNGIHVSNGIKKPSNGNGFIPIIKNSSACIKDAFQPAMHRAII